MCVILKGRIHRKMRDVCATHPKRLCTQLVDTTLAVQWPLTGVSKPAIFKPSPFKQDDGLIRLNIDESQSRLVDLD
jgi:hypothetical protein